MPERHCPSIGVTANALNRTLKAVYPDLLVGHTLNRMNQVYESLNGQKRGVPDRHGQSKTLARRRF
jgi:hypothetical protein